MCFCENVEICMHEVLQQGVISIKDEFFIKIKVRNVEKKAQSADSCFMPHTEMHLVVL